MTFVKVHQNSCGKCNSGDELQPGIKSSPEASTVGPQMSELDVSAIKKRSDHSVDPLAVQFRNVFIII